MRIRQAARWLNTATKSQAFLVPAMLLISGFSLYVSAYVGAQIIESWEVLGWVLQDLGAPILTVVSIRPRFSGLVALLVIVIPCIWLTVTFIRGLWVWWKWSLGNRRAVAGTIPPPSLGSTSR